MISEIDIRDMKPEDFEIYKEEGVYHLRPKNVEGILALHFAHEAQAKHALAVILKWFATV